MEKQISRVHKLALPLIVKRIGSTLVISDGLFEHDLEFKDFGQLIVKGTDPDGFVTFEVMTSEQQTLIEPLSPQSRTTPLTVDFTSIGRGTSKTRGASSTRGIYDYYKRASDEYYYTKYTLGSKTKKIHLGSLQDASSAIYRTVKAIQHLDKEAWFDRKELRKHLASSLSHGQKLKSVLDILTIEGYLERRESKKRGRPYEQYKTTPKLHGIK